MNTRTSAVRHFALITTLIATLGLTGCASAPPPPPKQILEYERHTAVGLEKHAHGYIAQAHGAFLRALAHAELDDGAERIAAALINVGNTELLLDNIEAAARVYARAVREARSVKAIGLEWQAQNGLAEATRRLGQAGKALELYAHRPDPGKSIAEPLFMYAEVGRALALAETGQTAPSLDLLDKLEATARQRPQPDAVWPTVLHARATVQARLKQHEEALTSAQLALDKDRLLHHPPSVADDHRLIAQLLTQLGREADAREHRDRAATIFAHTGQKTRLKSVSPTAEKN